MPSARRRSRPARRRSSSAGSRRAAPPRRSAASSRRGSTSRERYGFAQLVGHAGSPLDEEDRAHRRRAFGEPLIALFTRGQAAGEFSTAVTPEWATRMFGATVIAGARAVDDGALTRADAPDTVFHTLTQGLRS